MHVCTSSIKQQTDNRSVKLFEWLKCELHIWHASQTLSSAQSERNNFWQYIALVQDKPDCSRKCPQRSYSCIVTRLKKIRNMSPAIKSSWYASVALKQKKSPATKTSRFASVAQNKISCLLPKPLDMHQLALKQKNMWIWEPKDVNCLSKALMHK